MIYRLVKLILKFSFFLFYKKIIVTGRDKIPTDGPLMIAVNHPNTLIDPLIIARFTKQRVGFLGNASIFINKWVNAIFRYFHVIPIYRQQDLKPGQKSDNRAAFAECHQYLESGGTLMVFPEGTSFYELKLREIKTGTARIALSYEQAKQYQGNLRIIPISLDYADSLQFRTVVSVHVGNPISVADFKSAYEKEEKDGIVALTQVISDSLASKIPTTTDKDQEGFLIQAHQFYTTYLKPDAHLYANPSLSLKLRSALSRSLQHLHEQKQELYNDLKHKLQKFYATLDQYSITAGFVAEKFQRKVIPLIYPGYLLLFTLLLPFYLLGLLTNYLPYVLPGKIYKALNVDIEYRSSVLLVGGIVLFPLFYTVYLLLFQHFISDYWLHSIGFLLLLAISGFVTLYFWRSMNRFIRLIRFTFHVPKDSLQEIIQLRDEILKDLDQLKVTY
ncbi:1-acyl-sn-glycerol-3-phosphate acyltransferase [Ekhidna sp.]|uniref:1-acyl-sn-glycerol-3-phosphate acyltransferase n=1 Tax=Ekhidna sp. TaxID=2608089 RepID=UPI003B5059CB